MWYPYEFASTPDVVVGTVGVLRDGVFTANKYVVRCEIQAETETMEFTGTVNAAGPMVVQRTRRVPGSIRTWMRARGFVMIKALVKTSATVRWKDDMGYFEGTGKPIVVSVEYA